MGFLPDIKKDYTPSMDASRFASAGPSPIGSGYSEPAGMFSEAPGTFSTPRGMFMPEGSVQQDRAIKLGLKRDLPTALNPQNPAVKSASAPLGIGQAFEYRNRLIGADTSLSPFLSQPGFTIDQLRNGGLGII